MRDYSEKRLSREIVDRKPIAKNRPRKESGGLFVLLSLVAVVFSFGAGLATGWFLFKGSHKAAPAPVAQAVKMVDPVPATAPPKPDAPLTFYKTLPAGGKGVIGTGLNLKKPEAAVSAPREPQAQAPSVAPVPEPAAASGAAATPTDASAGTPATAAAAAPAKADASARFVVQVASYREKHEAVAAQTKLAGKGVAAYLVESRLADKGTWYRLRVGRHLTRAEAGELAAKSGKGAIVLPE